MHSTLRRGFTAACLLSVLAAPCARAVVVQSFSTTFNQNGTYVPTGVPSFTFWTVAPSAVPLGAVQLDFTIAGSYTLTEGNPFSNPLAWTPQLAISGGPFGTGVTTPAVNLNVYGTPHTIASAPLGTVYSTPATLTFTLNFSTLVTGPALSIYEAGSALIGTSVSVTPLVQFGYFNGTVTHSATATLIPAQDGGSALALLALGLTLCGAAHRLRSNAGASRVGL